MKTTSSTTWVVIFFVLVLSLAFPAQALIGKAVACEIQEQGWEVPDLEGLKAELVDFKEKDGKKFKNEAFLLYETFLVGRLSCEGKIYTYVFDGNKDGKIDYWIVDGDGDGIFETLCYPDDEAVIPEWVKQ